MKIWSKALLTSSETGRVSLLILEVQDEIYAFMIKIRVVIWFQNEIKLNCFG